jgi:hypothetical protein
MDNSLFTVYLLSQLRAARAAHGASLSRTGHGGTPQHHTHGARGALNMTSIMLQAQTAGTALRRCLTGASLWDITVYTPQSSSFYSLESSYRSPSTLLSKPLRGIRDTYFLSVYRNPNNYNRSHTSQPCGIVLESEMEG